MEPTTLSMGLKYCNRYGMEPTHCNGYGMKPKYYGLEHKYCKLGVEIGVVDFKLITQKNNRLYSVAYTNKFMVGHLPRGSDIQGFRYLRVQINLTSRPLSNFFFGQVHSNTPQILWLLVVQSKPNSIRSSVCMSS